MANCLVTKLKDTVNNEDLQTLNKAFFDYHGDEIYVDSTGKSITIDDIYNAHPTFTNSIMCSSLYFYPKSGSSVTVRSAYPMHVANVTGTTVYEYTKSTINDKTVLVINNFDDMPREYIKNFIEIEGVYNLRSAYITSNNREVMPIITYDTVKSHGQDAFLKTKTVEYLGYVGCNDIKYFDNFDGVRVLKICSKDYNANYTITQEDFDKFKNVEALFGISPNSNRIPTFPVKILNQPSNISVLVGFRCSGDISDFPTNLDAASCLHTSLLKGSIENFVSKMVQKGKLTGKIYLSKLSNSCYVTYNGERLTSPPVTMTSTPSSEFFSIEDSALLSWNGTNISWLADDVTLREKVSKYCQTPFGFYFND